MTATHLPGMWKVLNYLAFVDARSMVRALPNLRHKLKLAIATHASYYTGNDAKRNAWLRATVRLLQLPLTLCLPVWPAALSVVLPLAWLPCAKVANIPYKCAI
jgi:hypothetical protein